ncbi:hypothetical protein [Crenothrix polyspora]|uniref:Uncharacterized protein n=1 Tax=Crenothrix polyspora TaxID=360316 RepID=A0A1R4HA58_9GAMM|nr:hypothetical protein [Crenothrix polyspora]SJM93099.1 conserved hypothetical protein [Crenothrix polyspora]
MILKDEHNLIADGIARSSDLIGVIILDSKDRLSNPNVSFFAVWHIDKWIAGVSCKSRVSSLGVIGIPPNKFVLLNENGELLFVGGGQQSTEVISRDVNLPLLKLSSINGSLYASGMGRQVYRRLSANNWVSIHNGILNANATEFVGFQVLLGEIGNSIYAAGWRGEIWQYNGSDWSNKNSPTNIILSDGVITSSDDIVFCGRAGIIIRGIGDRWDLIADGFISDDLWSVVEYKNSLYFSSQRGIYRLVNNELEQIDIYIDGFHGTHYRLQVLEGNLFSFGEKDILIFNGNSWTRIATE